MVLTKLVWPAKVRSSAWLATSQISTVFSPSNPSVEANILPSGENAISLAPVVCQCAIFTMSLASAGEMMLLSWGRGVSVVVGTNVEVGEVTAVGRGNDVAVNVGEGVSVGASVGGMGCTAA